MNLLQIIHVIFLVGGVLLIALAAALEKWTGNEFVAWVVGVIGFVGFFAGIGVLPIPTVLVS